MNSFIIALALLSCLHFGTAANLIGPLKPKSCEADLFPKPPCCGIGNKNNGRIKFGTKATINEFPWMAFLEGCGGSLINSQWILTAAHCFDIYDLSRVHLGSSKCYENICDADVKVWNVKKIFKHEKYGQEDNSFHDIALLQLDEPVKFTDSIKPICLPTANPGQFLYGKEAIVAGWGKTEKASVSPDLLQTTVEIWTSDKCDSFQGFGGGVAMNSEYELCAGGEPNAACSGDSGGPLFLKFKHNKINEPYYQIGVVSGGPWFCGAKDIPQLYTNVSTYIDWIETTILKNQEN